MNFFTQTELKRLARRLKWLGRLNGLSRNLIGIAIFFALLQLVAAQMSTPELRVLVALVGLGVMFLFLLANALLPFLATRGRPASDFHRSAARLVEQTYPALDLRLLTALERSSQVAPATSGGELLARQLEQELAGHCRVHPWSRIIPVRRVVLAWCLLGVALVTFSVSTGSGALRVQESLLEWGLAGTPTVPPTTSGTADVDFDLQIEPGDAEIERGTPLLILARFGGAVPEEVAVRFPSGNGQIPSDLQMRRTLDDPVFSARLSEVNSPVDYEVVFRGGRSDVYHVTVFEYPRLVRADATITPPAYTAQEPTTLADVRELATVEGSRVRLTLQLNKPVEEAFLASVTKGGPTIELLPASTESMSVATGDETASIMLVAEIDLQETVQLELQLRDAEGRANRERPVFTLRALENAPPKLTVHFPERDLPVSPLQELVTEASAFDDFGLLRLGVTYSLASSEPTEVVLAENVPGGQLARGKQLISLESLDARPDQLLTYYFFADDIGADGEPRRTYGDLYFCEVRDFEEIFREGQQPPGGQSGPQGAGGQNGNQIEELTKLQQQIVTATWRIMRGESDDLPKLPSKPDTEGLAARLKIVADSEAELRKRL